MPDLSDKSPMPFGKYKGKAMQDVPAHYLHWLWTNGKEQEDPPGPVAKYIRSNFAVLKKKLPDAIWDHIQ